MVLLSLADCVVAVDEPRAAAVRVLFVNVSVVVLPTSVSVVAGKVSVVLPETAGALNVIDPEVSPEITTELIEPPIVSQRK